MHDPCIGRSEEDRHDSAHADALTVLAKCGEGHVVLEQNDLAHGKHGADVYARGGTMKCATFQWVMK